MSRDAPGIGEWALGLLRGPSLDQLSDPSNSNPILTGKDFAAWNGWALADPFVIQRNGFWYVFFELFLCNTPNAVIGAARSKNLRDWEPIGPVLDQPHHLSYPFVFEHGGQVYMMPESKSVKRVDLYRAVEFPNRWVFEKTLLRGPYMDCSLVKHRGGYWMFAGWRSYFLRLFYATNPLGPWKRHWLPIAKSYCKASTRPGGRPIQWNDQLIRFAQDNTDYYGQQLRAWQVTRMNRLWYSEVPLFDKPILQGAGSDRVWNGRCMHHIDPFLFQSSENGNGALEIVALVDGCA